MNCSEVQSLLVDLLYEEVDAEERSRLWAHLEACVKCGERWSRLRALSAAADRWTPPALPRGIAERALVRVAAERAREAKQARAEFSPVQVLRRILLGAGAALASLLLVTGIVGPQVPPLTVGALAVVWTVLYAGVLLLACHERLRRITRSALAGAGVALILVSPLSIPTVVEACTRLVRAAPGSAVYALALLLFAAGYTAGPLLAGGLVFGRSRVSAGPAEGTKLSLLYALLIAPAVYLQCLPLPLNVTAVWMAGAILGAWVGGPVSLWLARWRLGTA